MEVHVGQPLVGGAPLQGGAGDGVAAPAHGGERFFGGLHVVGVLGEGVAPALGLGRGEPLRVRQPGDERGLVGGGDF